MSSPNKSAADRSSPQEPAPPPLLKPLPWSERQRIQRQWERAWLAMKQAPRDFDGVHRLLVECVQADPASGLYVGTLLDNLQERDGERRSRPWLAGWSDRRRLRALAHAGDWPAVLQLGPDLLRLGPWDERLLVPIAEAAFATGCYESAGRYLENARRTAPNNRVVLRMSARVATRLGRLAEAAELWRQLSRLVPDDRQVAAIVEALSPAQAADAPTHAPTLQENEGVGREQLVQRLRDLISAEKWDVASRWLTASQTGAANDLELRELGEQITVGRRHAQVAAAERLSQVDPDPLWRELAAELRASLVRVELDVLAAKSSREPSNPLLLCDLASRLLESGNLPEAASHFEAAAAAGGALAVRAWVDAGECWQKLRQFGRATDCYETALREAER
ncbi:MAG TPA: tetratricopeptide repeat protein, partial [Pirellulaceae bacterium]|nr:tetratricopeptide repeat protein [Pirellulaceae bacterium]